MVRTSLVVPATAICIVAALLVAAAPPKQRRAGFLIPSQCRPAPDDPGVQGSRDAWPAPHTTACALEQACIESGYGLWVMDEKAFYRFDEAGQALALEHLRSTRRTSYNKVEILGRFDDPEAVWVDELTSID